MMDPEKCFEKSVEQWRKVTGDRKAKPWKEPAFLELMRQNFLASIPTSTADASQTFESVILDKVQELITATYRSR